MGGGSTTRRGGGAFAGVYDRGLPGTEEAGLREMRRETLSRARGRTIDIGAGTGANLGPLPAGGRPSWCSPSPALTWSAQLHQTPEGHAGSWSRLRPKPAVRGLQLRHRRLHARPLHGSQPAAALAEAARVLRAGRQAALPRARPSEDAGPGPLAGPTGKALALPRRRLPLQPRHRGHDRSLAAHRREGRAGRAAESAAAGQAAGAGSAISRLSGLKALTPCSSRPSRRAAGCSEDGCRQGLPNETTRPRRPNWSRKLP